jgi:hypothetical protein
LASQGFGFGRQPPPQFVVEARAAVAQWLVSHAVLLPQIFNHLLLGLIHPSRHRHQQESERIEDLFHVRAIIASLPYFPPKSRQFSQIQFPYITTSTLLPMEHQRFQA